MLWSLLKIVLFILLIGALTYGATLLMETDGALRIAFADIEMTLGPLQAAIGLLIVLLAVWVLLKLVGLLVATIRFLNGDETAISRYFDRSRERKGYRALSDAMLALAAGEGREALSRAQKAERYLRRPELTDLVIAQAAETAGDHRRAAEVYKRLVTHERTRFVGVRGLLKQKLDEGDTDTAFRLAEKAFALKPKHGETQDTLLRLQAGNEDWAGARKTLAAKLKHGTLPRDLHRRRDAVLALSEAREMQEEGRDSAARQAAIDANRMSPDLIPAAVMAARAYIANSQNRYATRVLKKAWEVQPHPELAAAFAEIEPGETPQARLRRFGTLTRMHPDHPETRMLLAELNIAAEDFPEARRALGDLATRHPTMRSVSIMAAIERGEGADEAVVRGWLARALGVSRGPAWVCENCSNIHADWHPLCGNCGAFDTLAWREPRHEALAVPGSAEMLPLLVGPSAPAANRTELTRPDGPPPRGVAGAGAGAGADTIEAAPADGEDSVTDRRVADAPDLAGSPLPDTPDSPGETPPPRQDDAAAEARN